MISKLLKVVGEWLIPTHNLDLSKYHARLPKNTPSGTTTKQIPDNVFYDKTFGRHIVKTDDKSTSAVAWQVYENSATTTATRNPQISDNDIHEINTRSLRLDRAIIVKPYWAKNVNRKDAAKAINIKGLGQSEIGYYYAAFSAAMLTND